MILDDEEELKQLKEQLESTRNHNIISEGSFTGKTVDLCISIVMTKIKGTIREKEEKVRKAILKFFQEKLKIRIDFEYFRPRVDPDP